MRKELSCACWILISLLLLAGCGETSNQNRNHSNVANNTVTNNNQAKSYNDWTTIKVEGEIEFQIPPTMEMQSEEWKGIENIIPNFINDVTDNGKIQRIVAHQKGLNQHEENAKKKYARLIIKIGKESEEVYPKWGEDISFSNEDLKYAEEGLIIGVMKMQPEYKLVGISQKMKAIKVNGISCLNMKYETQWGDRPVVKNDVYMFFNKDRIYILQTLIRSTEYEYWTSKDADMRNIVNTFKPCKS